MRDTLLRRLRRLGSDLPGPAKGAAQAALSAVDPLLVRRYRSKTSWAEPIPPVALRARSGSVQIAAFVRGGHGCEQLLHEALGLAGRSLPEFDSVLDFGAGSGRVLVPLWRRWRDQASFHGCDIDAGAIAWLRSHYPELPVQVNDHKPPLPYADGSFDFLYSVSVFTHLDEGDQFAWLREVRRVLRPGGIALATVHGERAFRSFANGEAVGAIRSAPGRIAAHSLDDGGFVYEGAEPSRWNALRYLPDGSSWGLAFHSEEYLRERWGEVFGSLEIVPSRGTQDMVLLGS